MTNCRPLALLAAAGSLVVLIAWVYYAAQIFLLGAEFTKVYAQAHGSHSAEAPRLAAERAAKPHHEHHLHLPHPHLPHHHAAAPAPSPALARLEQTRQRLEAEVPPRVAHMKSVAKKTSAAGGVAVAVLTLGVKLLRRHAAPRANVRRRRAPA